MKTISIRQNLSLYIYEVKAIQSPQTEAPCAILETGRKRDCQRETELTADAQVAIKYLFSGFHFQ